MTTKSQSLRVRVPLIFAFAALALAFFASQASAARYAYTGNYDTDSVSVIDTATNQVVGNPIPVGHQPSTMALTPDGKTLYVGAEGSPGGNNVTVINTQTNQVTGTIPLTYNGEDHAAATIAISPDGKTAYVVNYDAGVEGVLVIDLQTNQIVGSPIPVGGDPWGVAFSPDGTFAYGTDFNENKLEIIDTASRQSVASIPVGNGPRNVAFSPDGKTAYVTNESDNTVSVVDTPSRQVVGTPIPVGKEPWGVAVAPNGGRLYVSNYGDDTVTVIDTATRQVVGGPIPTGNEPYELVFTPDGKSVYVANYNDGNPGKNVTVINTQTNQPTDFDLAGGPWQIAIGPDQSPVASFTAKAAKKNPLQIGFSSTTTDADGTIAGLGWSFGDGKSALSAKPTIKHTYAKPRRYTVGLTAVDNEGCSVSMVFTGRTAYCSGAPAASKTIAVKAPNNFKFGKLVRNTKNGTAKLKIKVPYAGKATLSGKLVKKVKRGAKKKGTVTLAIQPKPTAMKQLADTGSAKVKIKVTFKPKGGKAKTKGRTVKLIEK